MALEYPELSSRELAHKITDEKGVYVAGELRSYLRNAYEMKQVHGRPAHPQTQGQIERYHRTMKNVVKLHHYYSPEELEAALEEIVGRYNNERYHEALKNLTPADVYYGRTDEVLKTRQLIKSETLKRRRKTYFEENYCTTDSFFSFLKQTNVFSDYI